MKDTIKAKDGYKIKIFRNGFNELRPITDRGDNALVFDGDKVLYAAKVRTMDDYIDECKNGNNECAIKYEIFTTVKGNQYIYWSDTETGEDFITKIVA